MGIPCEENGGIFREVCCFNEDKDFDGFKKR